jgi:hypothetical protein
MNAKWEIGCNSRVAYSVLHTKFRKYRFWNRDMVQVHLERKVGKDGLGKLQHFKNQENQWKILLLFLL